jgi:hypothetical protein
MGLGQSDFSNSSHEIMKKYTIIEQLGDKGDYRDFKYIFIKNYDSDTCFNLFNWEKLYSIKNGLIAAFIGQRRGDDDKIERCLFLGMSSSIDAILFSLSNV